MSSELPVGARFGRLVVIGVGERRRVIANRKKVLSIVTRLRFVVVTAEMKRQFKTIFFLPEERNRADVIHAMSTVGQNVYMEEKERAYIEFGPVCDSVAIIQKQSTIQTMADEGLRFVTNGNAISLLFQNVSWLRGRRWRHI